MKEWLDIRENIISLSDQEKYDLDTAIELVSQIINRRNELGISQRELANLSGIKQSAIARFEKLGTIPRVDTLLRIIRPLGLRIKLERIAQ